MKKLLFFLKDDKKESILAPLFKLLEASFELMVPLVVAAIVDIGIKNGDRPYIWRGCLLLAALALVGLACSVTAQFFAAKAAVGFGTRLRQAFFAHLQRLSFADSDRVGTAALITRMTGDINQVQSGVNMVLRLFLRSPFIVFGAMVMAFTVDRRAAFIFVVLILILLAVVSAVIIVGIPLYQRIQAALDRVVKITRENLTGVRVLRAFRREAAEEEMFAEHSNTLLKVQMITGRITGLLNPVTLVIVNISMIILLDTGAKQAAAGVLTQGAVIALVNYMSQILVELVKMANLILLVTKAFASARRVEGILALPLPDAEGIPGLPFPGTEGSRPEDMRTEGDEVEQAPPLIEFQDVSLRYEGAGEAALQKLSFAIRRGETVGIIGGTGAGKSSLVHLLLRFYETEQGKILIEGKELRNIPAADIRARIGIVLQKADLFRGTVRENLLWGREAADDEELWAALRNAQAGEFVASLAGQLDAVVEQEGRNFSGGQRQRLTIARALVRRPDILIFDDSASALDYLTEAALWQALRDNYPDTTVIIISQRASSVLDAAQILVLEGGLLTGSGTHAELLAAHPVYREIYDSQFEREARDE